MGMESEFVELSELWSAGQVIPYVGPGIWAGREAPFPVSPEQLALHLATKVTVPGKLKGRLWESAQYIESFKHRKTLVHLMKESFSGKAPLLPLHDALLKGVHAPLVVDVWYDSTLSEAIGEDRIQMTATSRSEHPGQWYRIDRKTREGWVSWNEEVPDRMPVLYKPFGSHVPGGDYIVSDADFVEILTEIDIQTPIPPEVQEARTGRHFLFLGCRFDNQTSRIFARQIMKRSADRHWMVADHELTPKERRFVDEQKIRILPVANGEDLIPALSTGLEAHGARRVLA